MRTIQVQSPGLFTTVQDLGREDFGPIGVSASGVADSVSLRMGNRLVGNAENIAALEMTLMGGTFLFSGEMTVALVGSDFGATLDNAPVQMWTSFEVKTGQVLKMGSTQSGARCYLCVHGGIDVKPFLGSASTHVLSGTGGFDGRALRKGDVLRAGDVVAPFRKRRIAAPVLDHFAPRKILRATNGPQSERFLESSRRMFYSEIYRVTEESNRMGLRLKGSPALTNSDEPMISEGVSLGAVQITAGGMPIILFVEQQTTGGYPIIANIISADMHSVGQLRPRDEIRFELVDFDTAHRLLMEQENLLTSQESIIE